LAYCLVGRLSRNIREAYQWLIERYNPGDEIFIFGFSRGAYTARSLTGYIARFGLLKRGSRLSPNRLYRRYRHCQARRTIWNLIEGQKAGTLGKITREEELILKYSQPINIKFVGVWDTVGTLGIPLFHIPRVSRSMLGFHDTGLRRPMENGFHALALDELRQDFVPTLWTLESAADSYSAITDGAPRPLTSVEQRWFVGSHDNVGGGLKNDALANIPLRWIMKKALLHGLAFQNEVVVDADVVTAPIFDSYGDMWNGLYARWTQPYLRTIGGTQTVNETIDVSVFDRWRSDPEYHPNNLVDWVKRHDVLTLNKSVRADKPKEAAPD
jgi:uncharacterized protein (DUF2235 family)